MRVFITARHMEGGNQHEHIASVRWVELADSGKSGESSRQQMVRWIRDEKGKACVKDGNGRISVAVVDASPAYLRTVADGVWTDNLLALPTF
jgi:hypothetical protein